MPAGLSGIYALTQEGKLLWYRHDGFLDGSMKWDGAREVGRGWGNFKQIIPMGDGIIYAITQDGSLEWRRHAGYLDGRGLESPGAWEGPRSVGSGGVISNRYSPAVMASFTRSQTRACSSGIATRIT